MAINNPNDFKKFRELVASGKGGWEPARSNLYSVEIIPPKVLLSKVLSPSNINAISDTMRADYGKARFFAEGMNYFADDVTVPSRQITTGEVKTVGSMRRYATGTTFSEISISFLVTKNLFHRTIFERWMNYSASDAENRVAFYDQYTADIQIKKWELGSDIVQRDISKNKFIRYNKPSGIWHLVNAFPFNVGAMSFNNSETSLMKLDVSFYFERYRFDDLDWGETTGEINVFGRNSMSDMQYGV